MCIDDTHQALQTAQHFVGFPGLRCYRPVFPCTHVSHALHHTCHDCVTHDAIARKVSPSSRRSARSLSRSAAIESEPRSTQSPVLCWSCCSDAYLTHTNTRTLTRQSPRMWLSYHVCTLCSLCCTLPSSFSPGGTPFLQYLGTPGTVGTVMVGRLTPRGRQSNEPEAPVRAVATLARSSSVCACGLGVWSRTT